MKINFSSLCVILCGALCLRGECLLTKFNHRDTENTEVTQRNPATYFNADHTYALIDLSIEEVIKLFQGRLILLD